MFSSVEGNDNRVTDKPNANQDSERSKDDDKPEEDKEEEGASGISSK